MTDLIERIAKALAFDELTEKGRADCVWPDSFGELELEHYRKNARAVVVAIGEAADGLTAGLARAIYDELDECAYVGEFIPDGTCLDGYFDLEGAARAVVMAMVGGALR